MSDIIIVAIVSFAANLIATFSGIITSARLTNYRIEQLEAKVGRHNNLEGRLIVVEEACKTITRDIEELRKEN
jgi:hypothetical protein